MLKLKIVCVLLLGFLATDGWAQCHPTTAQFISAAHPMDLTAKNAVNSQTYSINERGAQTFDTTGATPSVTVGYATLQASGGATPSSYLTFQFRENAILVGQASVPATVPVQNARIFADVSGPVNTGVAIANPNPSAVTITFYFTNAAGQNFGNGSFTIPANAQMARFMTEAPFSVGQNIQGTMTISASAPVGIIALLGYTNERSEFLITTLPVTTNLSAAASGSVYMPHFADGGGWTTQVVLVNPTNQPLSGTVQFFGQGNASAAGQPLTLTVQGQVAASFPYTIPAQSSVVLGTSGAGASITVGSVHVTPSPANGAPSGLAIFSFKNNGVTVSQAGVPSVATSNAFRMYEIECGDYPGQIQTGVAITNPSAVTANVMLDLTDLTGAETGMSTQLTIAPGGQTSHFMQELIAGIPYPFHGVINITSNTPVAVVGLRGDYNTRGDFIITTAMPTDATAAPLSGQLIYPHLVDGGGYTTEFVMYSGAAGTSGTGTLKFFAQNGQTMSLSF